MPNAYLIAFGSFLLLGGRLADLDRPPAHVPDRHRDLHRARSCCARFAGSEAALIAARFVQGVGAALCASAVLALIVVEFPNPAERIRAMSAYTFVQRGGGVDRPHHRRAADSRRWTGTGSSSSTCRSGSQTFGLGLVTLARDRGLGIGRDLDVLGSALITVAAMVAIYAIVGSEEHGLRWGAALGAVAVALVAAFVAVERKAHVADPPPQRHAPAQPDGLLSAVRALMVCGMWASFFVGALYMQRVLGMGPIAAGAAFLPQTLTVAALSLGPTARLTARFGERRHADHRACRCWSPGSSSSRSRSTRVRRTSPGSASPSP